ncbi:unnamed protein product, partial [Closterium sp. NIES-53]
MATRVSLLPVTSRALSLDPPNSSKREVKFGGGFPHPHENAAGIDGHRQGLGTTYTETRGVNNESGKGEAGGTASGSGAFSCLTGVGGGLLNGVGSATGSAPGDGGRSDAWSTLLSLPRQPQQSSLGLNFSHGLSFSPAPSPTAMGFAHGLSFTPAAPPTPVPRSSSHGLSFSPAPSPTAMGLSFTPAAHPTPVPRSSNGQSPSHSTSSTPPGSAGGGSGGGSGGGGGGGRGGNWPMFRGLAARHASADSLLSLASSETSSLASFATASDRLVEQEINRRAALDFVTELAGPLQPPSSPAHSLSGERTPPAGATLGATFGANPGGALASGAALLSASLSGDLPITANELPVAVFAVDRDLVCALWNRRMAELTGWAEGEIMRLGRFAEGRFAERLFRPASASAPFRRCEDVLRAALFGRDIVTAELLLLKRGGSCARVRLFASARTDALGAVCGAICAVIPASSGGGGGSAAALSAASAHGFDVDGGGGGGSGGGLPPFAPSFAAGETEEWLQRNASAGSLYGMHSVDEESVG